MGAFEIYIYNVLVCSKLISGSWPNHYKVLQVLNDIVKAKREGLPLEGFSVYREEQKIEDFPKVKSMQGSPEKNE